MAYERKDYSGSRAETTLAAGINNSATSFNITSATGWPSGTNGKFFAVIDPGTASEEKILVTSRTGTTLNTITRGVDGTSAAAHDEGVTIYPCFTATDADEANYAVAETVGKVTTAGDLLVADGANSLDRLAKGANSRVLAVSSAGALGYVQATNAMLAGMARGTVKVGDASGVASDLALGGAGTVLTSDGTDVSWAGGADSWVTVTKQSDESVASSTTFQDDDELFFTPSNGVFYEFQLFIFFTAASGTPDFQFGLQTNGNAAGLFTARPLTSTVTEISPLSPSSGGSGIAFADTAIRPLFGQGVLVGAGVQATFRWAQNTSSADAVTVKAGSILRYRQVA